MALTSGCSSRPLTASWAPWTTLSTPAGPPASRKSLARVTGTDGSCSEGLRMKALPAASAGPAFHSGIMAGKLNGVMPATTPSGWRTEWTSTPVPTDSENSPLSRCGAPRENSTTSRPRCRSPWASGKVLPCSSDRSRAMSSALARMRRIHSLRTRVRFSGLQAPHSFCASLALATARSTSALSARPTVPRTAPVDGMVTSMTSPSPWTSSPPMMWGMRMLMPGVPFVAGVGPSRFG